MADHIKIHKAEGKWVVRAGGAIIGESAEALSLTEGSYPPVVYFPREDIGMVFLEKTEKTSHCPHKGDATYYSVVTSAETLEDVAWSYEDPNSDVAAIKGHLAFYPNHVAVEKL